QHKGQQLALAWCEERGARIGRIDDRLRLKGACDARQADHDGAMIIELKSIADAQWDGLDAWLRCRLSQLASGSDDIHNDGIAVPETRRVPGRDGRRSADQGGIVEAHHVAGLEGAICKPCLEQALIQRYGPLNPLYTADAVEFRILQRLDVIDKLHLGVH